MKHLSFIAMIALSVWFSACQKEEKILPIQSEMTTTTTIPPAPPAFLDDSTSKDEVVGYPKAAMTEYMVTPKFGKPSSTYYYFKVYDPSGALALSVKFYERATGTISYKSMSRSGNYWVLSTTISINGWYDWRYVYSSSKTNISGNAYTLCNSKNTFSSTSSISWPFGADGSSWYNRTVYVNGSYQTWKGGEEGGSGNGWGDGYHTGNSEYYSDDWNRGTGSQDLGAAIRSPLDGYVAAYGTYSTSLGPSKYVAIVQGTSGNTYRFYVGHLNTIEGNLYVGKYVRAGVTKIGTLGMTGASSPHAHTSLRNVTNGANTSVPFYFNAN